MVNDEQKQPDRRPLWARPGAKLVFLGRPPIGPDGKIDKEALKAWSKAMVETIRRSIEEERAHDGSEEG